MRAGVLLLSLSLGLLCAVHVSATAVVNASKANATKVVGVSSSFIKSEADTRSYRRLVLPNGLQVLLVHDGRSSQGAASMDIGTGYWHDPAHIPGLNHFLEHMLFLGTAKYNTPGEWRKFLGAHGGSSNAYTAATNMNFHFGVNEKALDMALDRFAQFFIAPLLTAEATSKEIHAVNAENMKNLQNDVWRSQQLLQSLSNKSYPYHQFSTGNKATLTSVPQATLHQEMLKIHQKYFVAQNMRLAVLGRDSLDHMQSAVERYFSAVRSGPGPKAPAYPSNTDWSTTVMPHSLLGHAVYIRSVKDLHQLRIMFPIPPQTQNYASKSVEFVSAILGAEGEGSLLRSLKAAGWASHLQAGVMVTNSHFDVFNMKITLTKHVKKSDLHHIYERCLRYIKHLEQEGVQSWRWIEEKRLAEIHFRLQNKVAATSYVSRLSATLRKVRNATDLLAYKFIFREWKPDVVKSLLRRLVPSNMIVFHSSRHPPVSTSLVEPWYNTHYAKESLSLGSLNSARHKPLKNHTSLPAGQHLSLPQPNHFIPSSLAMKTPPKVKMPFYPVIVQQEATEHGSHRVWWKQDTAYHRPIAQVMCKFWTPQIYASARDVVLATLYARLVKEHASEIAWDAKKAGYFSKFKAALDGFELTVKGYDNGMASFVERLGGYIGFFEHAHDPVDPKTFKNVKDALVAGYHNFLYGQPLHRAAYSLSLLLGSPHWHISEYIVAAKSVQLDDVMEWAHGAFNDMRLECLVVGNVLSQEAIGIVDGLRHHVPYRSNSQIHFHTSDQFLRIVQLDGAYTFTEHTANPVETNSAAYVYYQYEGEGNIGDDVKVQMLGKMMSKQCFHELRTKEALGYLVFCGTSVREGVNGIRVDIQSPKKHAAYLDKRIHHFLHVHMRAFLRAMGPAFFVKYRNSMISHKSLVPSTLAGLATRLWYEIKTQQYNFVRNHFEAQALRTITYQDFLAFYDQLIGHHSVPSKISILVDPRTHKTPAPTAKPVKPTVKPTPKPTAKPTTKATPKATPKATAKSTPKPTNSSASTPKPIAPSTPRRNASTPAPTKAPTKANSTTTTRVAPAASISQLSADHLLRRLVRRSPRKPHRAAADHMAPLDDPTEVESVVPETEELHKDQEENRERPLDFGDHEEDDADEDGAHALAQQEVQSALEDSDVHIDSGDVLLELDALALEDTDPVAVLHVPVEYEPAKAPKQKKKHKKKMKLAPPSKLQKLLAAIKAPPIPTAKVASGVVRAKALAKMAPKHPTNAAKAQPYGSNSQPCGNATTTKHGEIWTTILRYCNGTVVEKQTTHCPNCKQGVEKLSAHWDGFSFKTGPDDSCNKAGPRRVYPWRPVTLANIEEFKNGQCLFPKKPIGHFTPSKSWWLAKHGAAAKKKTHASTSTSASAKAAKVKSTKATKAKASSHSTTHKKKRSTKHKVAAPVKSSKAVGKSTAKAHRNQAKPSAMQDTPDLEHDSIALHAQPQVSDDSAHDVQFDEDAPVSSVHQAHVSQLGLVGSSSQAAAVEADASQDADNERDVAVEDADEIGATAHPADDEEME